LFIVFEDQAPNLEGNTNIRDAILTSVWEWLVQGWMNFCPCNLGNPEP